MRLIKLFLFVLFILTLTFSTFAQSGNSVSGNVSAAGDSVPNVQITLQNINDPGIKFETVTDANGHFSFQDVPFGRYQLIGRWAEKNAFFKLENIAVNKDAKGTAPADVILDPVTGGCVNCTSIRESVTIAAGENQSVEQVAKTVDTISGREMRERADFSLVDSLRSMPGMQVQQLGGFGRTASIKSRGLRNQDTAILIDGIRFRDATAITGDASSFLSDITLTSVSKVEVLRGSGSSLYGTNAIGGVVDLQTPQASRGTHGQISANYGGYGLTRFRGNIAHGTSDGKFGIGAAISQTTYTKGLDGQDNARNTNFQSRLDYSPDQKTHISGRIFFSNAKVRLNVSPDTLGLMPSPSTIIDAKSGVNFVPDANDPDAFQRSRSFNGQIVVDHAVNSKFSFGGYYQGSGTHRRNDDGPLGPGYQSAYFSSYDGQIHTVNAHAAWSVIPENKLTGGYEFELEKYSNDGGTPAGTDAFRVRTGQRSNTYYIQDLVELLDGQLTFAGGFRAQTFRLSNASFTPASSLFSSVAAIDPATAYTADGSAAYYISQTGTKIRAHVGNGYRVPSLYERFGTYFFLGSFSNLGNPQLKPERSIGYDGGVDQYFLKDRIKLAATYFYTKIKDEITYLPTADFTAPSYYNFDRHYSRGAEFSGSVKATSSTDVFASYTFTNSVVRNFSRPTIITTASTDRAAYSIPDHQFTLVATQRIRRAWVNFDFNGTSSYLAPVFSNSTYSTYIYRFKGRRRGDLTGGYTFALRRRDLSLRLYGTIENVFGSEYYENGFRTAGRNGRIGLSFGF